MCSSLSRRIMTQILVRDEYDPIHPPDAITTHLPKEKQYVLPPTSRFHLTSVFGSLGKVDPGSVKNVAMEGTADAKERQKRRSLRPPLDEILNLHDFEVVAPF